MVTNDALRAWWGPGCLSRSDAATVIYDNRRFYVHPATMSAWHLLFEVFKYHRYSIDEVMDDWSLACRKITGGSKLSLHSFGIAIDVNATSNPYGAKLVTDMSPWMINDALSIRTRSGKQVFRWGGSYSRNKDAMHFEIVVSPADIATGVTHSKLRPQPGEEIPMGLDQNTLNALLRGSADAGEAKMAAQRMEAYLRDVDFAKLQRQVDVLRRGLVPENSDDFQDVTPMHGVAPGTKASGLLRFARESAVNSRGDG